MMIESQKTRCIGFPKRGECQGMTNRNPVWCDECDKKRIEHLGNRFTELLSEFDHNDRR